MHNQVTINEIEEHEIRLLLINLCDAPSSKALSSSLQGMDYGARMLLKHMYHQAIHWHASGQGIDPHLDL